MKSGGSAIKMAVGSMAVALLAVMMLYQMIDHIRGAFQRPWWSLLIESVCIALVATAIFYPWWRKHRG